MKIGVLTWKLYNFGTALQAYAMVQAVSENITEADECNLLNYNLPGRDPLVIGVSLSLKDYLLKVENRILVKRKSNKNKEARTLYEQEIKTQHVRFREFYNEISHDDHKVLEERDYFDQEYEKIIVGSDQIWNPKYFCETYFLDFVSRKKRYSYAPSMGVDFLRNEEKEYLKQKLGNGKFQNISVREQTGKKLLQEILPKENIECVLDPTLLFTGIQWSEMLHLSEENNDNYILVYTLSDNRWYKEAIKKIQKEIGVEKVIYITPEDNLCFYQETESVIVDAGPVEFVSFIKNAKYIITDSFHGVCFALNFERNFTCLSRFGDKKDIRSENSRLLDLLDSVELKKQFFNSNSVIEIGKIDYEQVSFKLEKLRKQSKEYLKEIVGEKERC